MNVISKIVSLLGLYIEDILIFSGLIFIIRATFLLNYIVGLYVLGAILLILGLILSENPLKITQKPPKT